MSEAVISVSDDSFDPEVLQAALPVLVDFWAEWCGPCRMMAKVIDKVAQDYQGRLIVAKLNVDQHRAVANKYGIRSIPTLIIFKDGNIQEQMIGALSEAKLKQKLDAALQK